MSFVIYNRISFKRMMGKQRQESFATERSARAVLTRAAHEMPLLVKADWIVATYDAWRAAEPMVETHNMLDPERKPIPIRASDLGTCVDPATERYHSM